MAKQEADFDELLKSPADHFDNPGDIVDDPGLSHDQKVKLLRQWEFDEREKSVALEENMQGENDNRLSEVVTALDKMGAHADGGPTKQGG